MEKKFQVPGSKFQVENGKKKTECAAQAAHVGLRT